MTDVIITVGHLADLIIAYFGDGSQYGVRIKYSERETTPIGTAGSLSMVSGLNETFIVMNGDLLTTLDFSELLAFHKKKEATATIAVCERDAQINFGVIEIDDASRVSGYTEKPTFHYFVSMGVCVFEPSVLSAIPRACPFDIPDLIKTLLQNGQRVVAYKFGGYWQDIGRFDDYQKAVEDFDRRRSEFLGESAFVSQK